MDNKPEAKHIMESLVCPDHKEHPEVEKQPDGSMKIYCCCTHFKTYCIYILRKLLVHLK